ncbi:hypothetical protein L873DRAFT_405591 [Choiromyces venosus 120613-1]|uniref:Uncharacterized protein n=1 Tax=Choiromyces venosus 120613-1 TaxID=1336337 RepID=A0A3N4JVT1_9PEZI|nr:hypothetical protein L873DRAFT_405591 [Choiromyces venosus 120613-1]
MIPLLLLSHLIRMGVTLVEVMVADRGELGEKPIKQRLIIAQNTLLVYGTSLSRTLVRKKPARPAQHSPRASYRCT